MKYGGSIQGKVSKAMADQLATLSKIRLFQRADIITEEDMHKVEQAIKLQLGIT
jgi:mRNA interferase MazF